MFAPLSPVSFLSEGELIERINQGFPASFWLRFQALAERRDAGTLMPEEHAEIIALSDHMEAQSVERLQLLTELSNRRGVEPRELIRQFNIRSAQT